MGGADRVEPDRLIHLVVSGRAAELCVEADAFLSVLSVCRRS